MKLRVGQGWSYYLLNRMLFKTFPSVEDKRRTWKMFLRFCVHTINVFVVYCCFGPHWLSKHHLLCSSKAKKNHVWNNMRKWWQILNFWVIYAFKVIAELQMKHLLCCFKPLSLSSIEQKIWILGCSFIPYFGSEWERVFQIAPKWPNKHHKNSLYYYICSYPCFLKSALCEEHTKTEVVLSWDSKWDLMK